MTDIILFFGQISSNTHQDAAIKYSSSAKLLTADDCDQYLNESYNNELVVYSSFEDIQNLDCFKKLINQCKKIYYYPENNITIDYVKKQFIISVEIALANLNQKKQNVVGLDQIVPDIQNNTRLKRFGSAESISSYLTPRKTDDPQLWLFGACNSRSKFPSVSNDKTFGNVIAKKLNLESSVTTEDGCSYFYGADLIMRSDIKEGDIVIWDLLEWHRLTYVNNKNKLIHIGGATYESDYKMTLAKQSIKTNQIKQYTLDKHLLTTSVLHVFQVINFCQKIGAKLLLVHDGFDTEFSHYFINTKEFFHAPMVNVFVENRGMPWHEGRDGLSSDNHFKGKRDPDGYVKAHNQKADACIQYMKTIGYI